jgi:anti-anti-sigma factor
MNLLLLSDHPDLVRLRCAGDIREADVRARPLFESLLGADCFHRTVLLSLDGVPYIDSSGIGWLIISHRRFTNAGGKLVLHSLTPEVDRTLDFARMHSYLAVALDEAEALGLARPPDMA